MTRYPSILPHVSFRENVFTGLRNRKRKTNNVFLRVDIYIHKKQIRQTTTLTKYPACTSFTDYGNRSKVEIWLIKVTCCSTFTSTMVYLSFYG